MIAPNNDYYTIYKGFYGNGNIKEKGLLFGHVKIGVWEYYNEKGELIRTENEDEKFSKTFNYNDIIDFLHERGKINKYHRNATHELSTSFRKLDGVWKWGVGVYYNKTKKKIITYQGHRYQFDINGKLLSMEENVKIISGGTVH